MTEVQIQRWAGNTPDADPTRCALVLPGRAYPVQLPGLALPLRALALDGWTVWHASWELGDIAEENRQGVVTRAVRELDELTASSSQRLVLGKSLGTYAAAWAADHEVPAIWHGQTTASRPATGEASSRSSGS